MKPLLPTLLVALALTAQGAPALAQESAGQKAFYRVEVIIFTHAGGNPDAWPVRDPADHADAVDPAWNTYIGQRKSGRADSGARTSTSELEAALNVVDTIASLERGEENLAETLLYPEPWLSLNKLSGPMAQARSRLERSGAFRVRASLAWHQPLDRSIRTAVRIHDDEPVAAEWVTLGAGGRLLRNGRPVRTAEDLMPDVHYRLDGTIRLRQRQFMHADVTVDWREPQQIGPSAWPVRPMNPELEVHKLEQSRAIRAGRYEYFDSEWLGVLLRVTPYQPEATESGTSQTADAP